MPYFPLCISLADRPVYLVGSGSVLERKLRQLLPYSPRITVFSPGGGEFPGATVLPRLPEETDLTPPPAFLLMCGGTAEEQERISTLCRRAGVPVNVEDVPPLCTFYFPALITRGDLTVSLSTGGKSPAVASLLRARLEEALPDRTGEILDWAAALRAEARARIPDPAARGAFLRKAVALALEKDRPLTDGELSAL